MSLMVSIFSSGTTCKRPTYHKAPVNILLTGAYATDSVGEVRSLPIPKHRRLLWLLRPAVLHLSP
jgi:hypothetical protein